MRKILGIFILLIVIMLLTTALNDRFISAYNLENLLRRIALFGILGIGASFVIITSGIDLSIGSVVCLSGCLLPWLMNTQGIDPLLAFPLVIILGILIGLWHGILITKLRLQPFVVTLCGLLLYRGVTRGLVNDQTQGFGLAFDGLRTLAVGRVPLPLINLAIPAPFIVLLILAALSAFVLKYTLFGRYLYAVGNNPEAARFSGINSDRIIICSYVGCSLLACLGGMLFVLDVNSAQPADFGNFYELYAIAAAVLGGCSLRGGSGSVAGVIIGTAVMQVLRNSITLLGIPTQLEFAIIGLVLLIGVGADEAFRISWKAKKA